MWNMGATIVLLTLVGAPGESSKGASEAEVAKLRKDMLDQRQLLIAILKAEQKRNDMLVRYLLMNEPPGATEPDLQLPAASVDTAPQLETSPAEEVAKPRRPPVPTTATLKGQVTITGHAGPDVYVYVENVNSPAVNASFEIKQENKQFSPRVAVVQKGTKLLFSNADSIYHNVFSASPGYTFDLGAYRKGDGAKSVVTATPGVIEIFCNMHSRMTSTVLVVPNAHFVKVERDGGFVLHNVPVGSRRLVAWAPGAPAVRTDVEVHPGGSEVRMALDVPAPAAHPNKFGQPYGSYDD